MKIEGSYKFAKDRSAVWGALQDPQTLASTLPGVRRLEVVAPDRYSITAHVGVGSITGLFDGTFEVTDKNEYESCLLRGSARGSSGSTQVEARVLLADSDGSGSQLTYDADASVTGPIAGVGQRMIQAASKRMAQQFFQAIDGYSSEEASQSTRAVGDEAGTVFTRQPSPGPDLRVFVAGVIVGFLLALVGVAVGRRTAR